jgi:hypothetical protein
MFKDRYDSRRTGQDYDGFPNCEYRNDRTIKWLLSGEIGAILLFFEKSIFQRNLQGN